MTISSKTPRSFYYEIKSHCDRAFLIKTDGSVHDFHGIIIKKLCGCEQGIEAEIHSSRAELEGQAVKDDAEK